MEIGSFQPKSSELGDPKWSDNLKVMFFSRPCCIYVMGKGCRFQPSARAYKTFCRLLQSRAAESQLETSLTFSGAIRNTFDPACNGGSAICRNDGHRERLSAIRGLVRC